MLGRLSTNDIANNTTDSDKSIISTPSSVTNMSSFAPKKKRKMSTCNYHQTTFGEDGEVEADPDLSSIVKNLSFAFEKEAMVSSQDMVRRNNMGRKRRRSRVSKQKQTQEQ